MQRHRQGLRHGGFTSCQAIGGHALARIGHKLFAKCALNVGERHGRPIEAHVEALVVAAFTAEFAGVTGARWRDANQLSDAQTFDAPAQCCDVTRHFMAKDHGLLQANYAEAAMVEVMQVRAANAADCKFDRNLPRRRHINGALFNAKIFGSVNDDGFHQLLTALV